MSGTLGTAPVRTAWVDGVHRVVGVMGVVGLRWAALRRQGGLSARWGVPLAVLLTAGIASGTVWLAATWAPA